MKLKAILETNPDGTISKDETKKQQKLLKAFEKDMDILLKKYAKAANLLGGQFRSPAYRAQLDGIVKLIDYYYNNDDKKEKIDLYAFVGFAGWSRTQLLGEISRRHWGLCKTKLSDLIDDNNENTDINIWDNIWNNIYNSGRTIIAASSEFSDSELI